MPKKILVVVYYLHKSMFTRKRGQKLDVRAVFGSLSKVRLSRADSEVAGYLWLDVFVVDINVGYCKHLTVRISIRRQLDARSPLERVKRVTRLRRTASSSRCIMRGEVHHRRRAFDTLDRALLGELRANPDENMRKHQRYLLSIVLVYYLLLCTPPNYLNNEIRERKVDKFFYNKKMLQFFQLLIEKTYVG